MLGAFIVYFIWVNSQLNIINYPFLVLFNLSFFLRINPTENVHCKNITKISVPRTEDQIVRVHDKHLN